MRNKDVEQIISNAFDQANPNLFNKIMEKCPNMETSNIRLSFWKKITDLLSSKKFAYSFSSFILIIAISLVWWNQTTPISQNVFSVIAIDVNPSLVLELDENDKVINVIKNNADAVIIIGDIDLIDVNYDVAVNAIIGSMVTKGYLNEFKNSVLLSIKSNDLVHKELLMTEVTQAVYNYLLGSSINGSVITQELYEDEAIKLLAERLQISEAKAELIYEITLLDARLTVEDLAKLSINDLNIFLESKNYTIDKIDKVGQASDLEYITKSDAYQLALSDLQLNEIDVIDYEIDFEQEDGAIVYKVKIETDTMKYKLLVNSIDGAILFKEETIIAEDEEDDFPVGALTEAAVLLIVADKLGLNVNMIEELDIEKET
ncbi:MAG: hypothetical protein KJ847_03025, partial [Firmicutes bacterium]|nr:hypothetical protein [Bacillota bacterium]